MRRGIWILAALLVSAGYAQASLTEEFTRDTLGLTYQNDGETHQDAPDTCVTTDAEPVIAFDELRRGQLVPVDDPADFWVLPVGPLAPETSNSITVEARPEPIAMDEGGTSVATAVVLKVHDPQCQELDAEEVDEEPSGDGSFTVTFTPETEGMYHIKVSQGGLGLVIGSALAQATPQDSHCAPMCGQGYDLRAT